MRLQITASDHSNESRLSLADTAGAAGARSVGSVDNVHTSKRRDGTIFIMPIFLHQPDFASFPTLKQCNLSSGRVYQVQSGEHTGKVYPSITRILHSKPKQGILEWQERVGHDEAERIRSRASNRGTKIHSLAERYLQNQELEPINPYVGELWQYLRPWLNQHITKIYQQETSVFSDKLGAAGRFDLFADVDGELSVVDFKQSNKPKKEQWILDYYLQGTFYSLAVFELTGKKVKRVIFPIVNPNGLQLFETVPLKHFTELRHTIYSFYKTWVKEAV